VAVVQSDNLGKFYRYVNGRMSGRKSISPVAAGNLITDKISQANIFNRYFASVFTCDDDNKPQFIRRVDPGNGCCDVDFSPIKVVKVFKALKPKKYYGPDGFPNILLKKLTNVLFEPLTCILQSSFRSHVLPTCWLHAAVTPVFKKGL